jgi:hypothetical protein
MKFRFTATLNRPGGSRVFKGTGEGIRDYGDALFTVRALLLEHQAFAEKITSLKVTISPDKRKEKQ